MSKTFRTVGVGSTQTLEKIENNKIPVYETKAAAEADIANLTDGQIIATKDEGNENAKPVDVVESGNMHAVTSNAVAIATGSKIGLLIGKSTDIIEAFSKVGIPNDFYTKTIKTFCETIDNYSTGVHSMTIGGPEYGFILFKNSNKYFVIDVLSYSDYANEIIRVMKVDVTYTVYRYTI